MAPTPEKKKKAEKVKPKVQEEADDEDALLDGQSGDFIDSFIVLCAIRFLVNKIMALVSKKPEEEEKEGDKKKKAAAVKEEEVLPFKEKAMEIAMRNTLPLFLMTTFVLTCALIIGGEDFDGRADRPKEVVDDYYGTLGVARDAETGEVKRAYKTLARRWHPDKNPNCSTCQETFSKIAVAYETLSDEKKRAEYDETGGIATSELKSPRSVPLTADNFHELVTFSNEVWIVQIFKPDDAGCAQFHPFWEHEIQKHGHLVRFGRVDVTNDQAKWLPVKYRVLPTVLKFSKHLGAMPEIFPITAMHETPQMLLKFVLTSFPNVGLPLHLDKYALQSWLGSSGRRHKVLLAIPGKSEEERYKSHLGCRKLAAQWSELFEFRTADPAVIRDLPAGAVPQEVRDAMPPQKFDGQQASVIFFPSGGGSPPRLSVKVDWPASDEDLMLKLVELAQLAVPVLDARTAELMCRSLATRRVYCLVLLDPSEQEVVQVFEQLKDSRTQYMKEVAEIREGGGTVGEEEDNFVVSAVRLYKQPRGLQASVAMCRAPAFDKLETVTEGSSAMLLDLDTGRVASLKGMTSFRGIYPHIAYEETLKWVEDLLHPFLSFPDCDETVWQHVKRSLRTAPLWETLVQLLTVLFLLEATAKAAYERSVKWLAGAVALLLLVLLRSPPFLRKMSGYLPGALFPPSALMA
eukprot:gnl/TRDRNA2_/TRDRNA2_38817_c0_seq1.p1 gnl/TRDRNA2_/TRDRNA2_38817_c0~~gnl/TRDRNA2_/TRDRNA2_38817_c0_seq1.p1  ORF type:complete len:688 (+),score=198.04 gnl/TRDRNA2_/TRDRNA2_38817_c0_seq1:104-2167(+)